MNEAREETTEVERSPSLFRSALLALLAAGLATVLFVLPAEYGVDPTGVGERLGLLQLAQTEAPAQTQESATPSPADERPARMITGEYPGIPEAFDYYEPDVLGEPYSKAQDAPFRMETFEIRLEEFEQVEYKARMRRGDVIVYSWSVDDGIVYTDFHADPGDNATGYPDQYFIRYRESENGSDSGSLVAPFDGNHGWYWLNIEDHPITISLQVAGYFERIDELFRSFQ